MSQRAIVLSDEPERKRYSLKGLKLKELTQSSCPSKDIIG